MTKFKFILLFLLGGYFGQACSLSPYKYCEIAIGKKGVEVSDAHYADNQDEIPVVKRKYKTKGLQVIMPHICEAYFKQYYFHKEYSIQKIINARSFQLLYIQGIRGPPLF